jgi:type III restriction enzyme
MDTLQSVVKGLNRAGFTDKDFRAIEQTTPELPDNTTPELPKSLFDHLPDTPADEVDDLDTGTPAPDWQSAITPTDDTEKVDPTTDKVSPTSTFVNQIKEQAKAENKVFETNANTAEEGVTQELEDKMNRHRLKDLFREEAAGLALPQFFIKVQNGGFFDADRV